MLTPNWVVIDNDQVAFVYEDYFGYVRRTETKRFTWMIGLHNDGKISLKDVISNGAHHDEWYARDEARIELERILEGESQGGTKSRGG